MFKHVYKIFRKLFTGMESKKYSKVINLPTNSKELDEERLYNNGYVCAQVGVLSKFLSHIFTCWMILFFSLGIFSVIGTNTLSLLFPLFVVGTVLTVCVRNMFKISKYNATVPFRHEMAANNRKDVIRKLDANIENLAKLQEDLKQRSVVSCSPPIAIA